MARNNEIVIAVVDGEVYVKRLQKDPVRRIIILTQRYLEKWYFSSPVRIFSGETS